MVKRGTSEDNLSEAENEEPEFDDGAFDGLASMEEE